MEVKAPSAPRRERRGEQAHTQKSSLYAKTHRENALIRHSRVIAGSLGTIQVPKHHNSIDYLPVSMAVAHAHKLGSKWYLFQLQLSSSQMPTNHYS
jgi:hypothetical protein